MSPPDLATILRERRPDAINCTKIAAHVPGHAVRPVNDSVVAITGWAARNSLLRSTGKALTLRGQQSKLFRQIEMPECLCVRKDKLENLNRFKALIEEIIATDPSEYQDQLWAEMLQPEWCAILKISDRTLRKLAAEDGIVSLSTQTGNGVRVVLYRLGEKVPKSSNHIANIMRKIYLEAYDLKLLKKMTWGCEVEGKLKVVFDGKQWGCLKGLAQTWPEGEQIEIFKTVLKYREAFMAGVHQIDPDPEGEGRFYEWIPISLMRKFPDVAVQLHGTKLQHAGLSMSPAMGAAYLGITHVSKP